MFKTTYIKKKYYLENNQKKIIIGLINNKKLEVHQTFVF
jgi:hypothetical protein